MFCFVYIISLLQLGTSLLCLFFHLLCYAAVLKILTYSVCSILCSCKNDLCLKSDCSIRVYSLVFHMLSAVLEYIKFLHIEIISMVSVLLEY